MSKLAEVFAELKALLADYAPGLIVTVDEEGSYHLDTFFVRKDRQRLFFAAVTTRTRYVSYHLMPVYVQPELLEGMSPRLRRRMQGKSCFNFASVDRALFAELAELTRRAYASFDAQGFVGRQV